MADDRQEDVMVEVTQYDANMYCRILSALGMEEEGDPVAEIDSMGDMLAQWEECWKVVGELAGIELRSDNKPLAVTASYALLGNDYKKMRHALIELADSVAEILPHAKDEKRLRATYDAVRECLRLHLPGQARGGETEAQKGPGSEEASPGRCERCMQKFFCWDGSVPCLREAIKALEDRMSKP